MVHWLFQQSETEADQAGNSPGKFPFQVEELGMCPFTVKVVGGGVTIFKSTGVYVALWHKAEPLLLPALAPNQIHFSGPTKCCWHSETHSSGFIHWSEVARVPSANKKSEEWDQWWPCAQDTSGLPYSVLEVIIQEMPTLPLAPLCSPSSISKRV